MRGIIAEASRASSSTICCEVSGLNSSTYGSRRNDDNIFHFCSTLCPKVSGYARDANLDSWHPWRVVMSLHAVFSCLQSLEILLVIFVQQFLLLGSPERTKPFRTVVSMGEFKLGLRFERQPDCWQLLEQEVGSDLHAPQWAQGGGSSSCVCISCCRVLSFFVQVLLRSYSSSPALYPQPSEEAVLLLMVTLQTVCVCSTVQIEKQSGVLSRGLFSCSFILLTVTQSCKRLTRRQSHKLQAGGRGNERLTLHGSSGRNSSVTFGQKPLMHPSFCTHGFTSLSLQRSSKCTLQWNGDSDALPWSAQCK